jgi:hypothetical protein
MIRNKKAELAMNKKETAEIWNEYFEKLLKTEEPKKLIKIANREINEVEELTIEDVKKAMRNVKNNTAAGADGIHLELIKYSPVPKTRLHGNSKHHNFTGDPAHFLPSRGSKMQLLTTRKPHSFRDDLDHFLPSGRQKTRLLENRRQRFYRRPRIFSAFWKAETATTPNS